MEALLTRFIPEEMWGFLKQEASRYLQSDVVYNVCIALAVAVLGKMLYDALAQVLRLVMVALVSGASMFLTIYICKATGYLNGAMFCIPLPCKPIE